MALRFRDLFKSKRGGGSEQGQGEGAAGAPAPSPAPPTDAATQATFEQAQRLQQQGSFEQALELYDRILATDSSNPQVHYKWANACNSLGRLEEALVGYERAIALDGGFAHALCNRGTVLERLGRWEDALASYDRALQIDAGDALTHYNRSAVLKHFGRLQEALAGYDQAIALQPTYVQALVNRGHLLQELKRPAEALASYERAIGLHSGVPEAYLGRGRVLFDLLRFEEAIASYDRALALRADYGDAWVNRATALVRLRRYEESIGSYDRGLELLPGHAESWRARGAVLVLLRRFNEAIASYDRSIELDPEQKYLLGMSQYARMQCCDWSNLESNIARLAEGLEARRAVAVPLPVLALTDSPGLHRLAAEIWVREECPRDDGLGPVPLRPAGGPIRIGFFSADFRSHPVSLLTVEMFERIDRSKFELSAFAFGPECSDPVRARLLRSFDRFIDVDKKSDDDAARLARELGLDIAVDLTGFTQNARTGIFARGAAPIQLSYLGYPGTLGADYMHYLIADRVLIPPGSEQHYAEKIIFLPDSYQANDSTRPITQRAFTRAELGLPEQGFVFCCFNRGFKLMPETFDCWMRILARVPGSVLWLTEADESARARLQQHAQTRGVAAQRLVFAPPMPAMADHLARQRAADLFLDTWPFNAHTTASDALWAGLPVLTCPGRTLPSRVAASLVTAVGLPELIAPSVADYEALAVELATQPERLGALRQRLADKLPTTRLFDTARFTRHMEAAFTAIYQRAQAGLLPEHIDVSG